MEAIHVNGRYLETASGKPFFYLADTAWEILHQMSREELENYMTTRMRQGFTCIQTVLLAELDGLRTPNFYGKRPLIETKPDFFDPESPDLSTEYSYWDHVDFAVDLAKENDLFMVLLPTWGDKINQMWGKGPTIFTTENAYSYGFFLGSRYKEKENIIWMLGGDRKMYGEHRKIIDAMANGIKDAGDTHLMTFHPSGGDTSLDFVSDAEYIDFHTSQTGHDTSFSLRSDEVMLRMMKETKKPCMDSEPRYEDHPACFNPDLGVFWGSTEVRQNAYWNVLTGTCGHTYGNHSVWSMTRDKGNYFIYNFDEVLTHDGAEQIGFIKKLRMSRDYFSYCHDASILKNQYPGEGHLVSGRGNGYIYIYSPLGLPIETNACLFKDAKHIKCSWFNPRTGEEQLFTVVNPNAAHIFVPETSGRGNDWVLILDEFIG